MRNSGKLLLVGLAAAALTGSSALALAGAPARHTMTVQLPDGSTARIAYTGTVRPKVTFDANPFAVSFFGPGSPFAQLDRISAQMDRQMAAMMRGRALLPTPLFADPNPLFTAGLERHAPAGWSGYSMMSNLSGSGACFRSVEITRNGSARPKVVSHTAGNCGGTNAAVLKAAPAARSGDAPMPIGTWRLLPSHNQVGPRVHEAAYQPQH